MNGKHVASIDGPKTNKNAAKSHLKPGAKNTVKGPPKGEVHKGIGTTKGGTLFNG